MKMRFTGLLIIAGLFLLSACGQKGPLYLEAKPAPKAAEPVVPAADKDSKTEAVEPEVTTPAAEKKD